MSLPSSLSTGASSELPLTAATTTKSRLCLIQSGAVILAAALPLHLRLLCTAAPIDQLHRFQLAAQSLARTSAATKLSPRLTTSVCPSPRAFLRRRCPRVHQLPQVATPSPCPALYAAAPLPPPSPATKSEAQPPPLIPAHSLV